MKNYKLLKGICTLCLLCTLSAAQAQPPLKPLLDALLKDKQAQVGVAVVFNGEKTFTYNNEHHYPLMSVCKLHQALAVLNYLDRHNLPLDTKLFVSPQDLLPDTYSPLRDQRLEGNFYLSVAELLQYSISRSDNNACDILFRYIGGVEVVDSYIRSLGITDFKIVATEQQLNTAFECQYLNWTTPLEAVRLVEKLRKTALFTNPLYREFLEETLIATTTGRDKLQAGLPEEAVLGHKTGSSGRDTSGLKAGDNDVGFVLLPDGREYSIAVFVTNSREDDKTNAAIISGISAKVYQYYNSFAEHRPVCKEKAQ